MCSPIHILNNWDKGCHLFHRGVPSIVAYFNPLSPKNDQHQISWVVMRIKDMITQDESKWYFIKFSPLCLLKMYTDNKWEFEFWCYGLKGQLLRLHSTSKIWISIDKPTSRVRPLNSYFPTTSVPVGHGVSYANRFSIQYLICCVLHIDKKGSVQH